MLARLNHIIAASGNPHRESEAKGVGITRPNKGLERDDRAYQRSSRSNTNSEILGAGWLLKLAVNLDQPKVGMVGATGSFESLSGMDPRFAIFPNVHLRSNAFMIRRSLLLEIAGEIEISDKLDAYLFESGPASLTNEVLRRGLDVQIVGRNGRGYPPRWWPRSETFRRLTQDNLLIADNQTRHYMDAVWSLKHALVLNTWGPFVDHRVALPG